MSTAAPDPGVGGPYSTPTARRINTTVERIRATGMSEQEIDLRYHRPQTAVFDVTASGGNRKPAKVETCGCGREASVNIPALAGPHTPGSDERPARVCVVCDGVHLFPRYAA